LKLLATLCRERDEAAALKGYLSNAEIMQRVTVYKTSQIVADFAILVTQQASPKSENTIEPNEGCLGQTSAEASL
jgi:hypothetical protein